MAGNWYLGGIQSVNDGFNAWNNGDMRASLIAGSTVLGNSQSWKSVADFTSAGNAFVTNATDATFPAGRLTNYDDPSDQLRFTWPNQILNLGTPTAGLSYCGILITDGPVTVPGSTVWGWQRVLGTTGGGPVKLGTDATTNTMFYMTPNTTVSAASCAGYLDQVLNATSDSWNGGSEIYHFALVRSLSSGWQKDWKFVLDALNGGCTFCTNCGWNEYQGNGGANPVMAAFNRASATLVLSGSYPYRYPTSVISGGLKWDGSLLQTGETAVGVLGYQIGPGSYDSPILMYNDIGSISLTTGTDLIWDSFDAGQRTMVEINLIGN